MYHMNTGSTVSKRSSLGDKKKRRRKKVGRGPKIDTCAPPPHPSVEKGGMKDRIGGHKEEEKVFWTQKIGAPDSTALAF